MADGNGSNVETEQTAPSTWGPLVHQHPADTLSSCESVVRFVGDAVDAVEANGGMQRSHGDAVCRILWIVADALHWEGKRTRRIPESEVKPEEDDA